LLYLITPKVFGTMASLVRAPTRYTYFQFSRVHQRHKLSWICISSSIIKERYWRYTTKSHQQIAFNSDWLQFSPVQVQQVQFRFEPWFSHFRGLHMRHGESCVIAEEHYLKLSFKASILPPLQLSHWECVCRILDANQNVSAWRSTDGRGSVLLRIETFSLSPSLAREEHEPFDKEHL